MVTFSKHISVTVWSTITMSVSNTWAPILNKQKMAKRCVPRGETADSGRSRHKQDNQTCVSETLGGHSLPHPTQAQPQTKEHQKINTGAPRRCPKEIPAAKSDHLANFMPLGQFSATHINDSIWCPSFDVQEKMTCKVYQQSPNVTHQTISQGKKDVKTPTPKWQAWIQTTAARPSNLVTFLKMPGD